MLTSCNGGYFGSGKPTACDRTSPCPPCPWRYFCSLKIPLRLRKAPKRNAAVGREMELRSGSFVRFESKCQRDTKGGIDQGERGKVTPA